MILQLPGDYRLWLVYRGLDARLRHAADVRLLPDAGPNVVRQAVGNGLVKLGRRLAEAPLEPAGHR